MTAGVHRCERGPRCHNATNPLLEALDEAETDRTVSEDAMRWSPPEPRRPAEEDGE